MVVHRLLPQQTRGAAYVLMVLGARQRARDVHDHLLDTDELDCLCKLAR